MKRRSLIVVGSLLVAYASTSQNNISATLSDDRTCDIGNLSENEILNLDNSPGSNTLARLAHPICDLVSKTPVPTAADGASIIQLNGKNIRGQYVF